MLEPESLSYTERNRAAMLTECRQIPHINVEVQLDCSL
jgi:hypothetical protein